MVFRTTFKTHLPCGADTGGNMPYKPSGRSGRPLLTPERKRKKYTIWFNDEEWAHIKNITTKAGLQPYVWVRIAALGRTPPLRPLIPPANIALFQKLHPLASNLNQLTHYAHLGYPDLSFEILNDIKQVLMEIRSDLLGIKHDCQNDEE